MAEWESFDGSKLFPTALETLATTAASTGDAVATVMDAAAGILSVTSAFVQGFSDAQTTLIETLQNLIVSATQQLTQNGVYMLVNAPISYKAVPTPRSWILQLSQSLDDTYDENRPILVDPYAYVGSITIVGASTSAFDIIGDFIKLFELFGVAYVTEEEYAEWPSPGDSFVVTPGVGKAPDWSSKRVSEIVPGIDTIVTELEGYSNGINAAAAASDIYSMFADILSDKAAYLREIATTINGVLTLLTDSLAVDGAYVLPVYGQGDSTWLQQQWTTATEGPDSVDELEACIGISFLATGSTSAPAEALFSLFGLTP